VSRGRRTADRPGRRNFSAGLAIWSESQQHQEDPYAHDGGSDDDLDDDDGNDTGESFGALEDRFHGLEEEVAILVADVHAWLSTPS
jgi:hypothetical protein